MSIESLSPCSFRGHRCEVLQRSPGANLGFKVSNNGLLEDIVFPVEIVQIYTEGLDLVLVMS